MVNGSKKKKGTCHHCKRSIFSISVVSSALLSFVPDSVETHEIDLDNVGCHGEHLVGISTNEKVATDKFWVSSIVIVRPNTNPGEIPYLKATAEAGQIKITSIAHKQGHLTKAPEWLAKLKANEKALDAAVLHDTLTTMVTHQKKVNKVTPQLKTTTLVLPKSSGMTLSHEQFAFESEDVKPASWRLKMVSLPCDYEVKLGNEKFTCMESTVIWRACITGTEQEITEVANTAVEDDGMSLLEKMMSGSAI